MRRLGVWCLLALIFGVLVGDGFFLGFGACFVGCDGFVIVGISDGSLRRSSRWKS